MPIVVDLDIFSRASSSKMSKERQDTIHFAAPSAVNIRDISYSNSKVEDRRGTDQGIGTPVETNTTRKAAKAMARRLVAEQPTPTSIFLSLEVANGAPAISAKCKRPFLCGT